MVSIVQLLSSIVILGAIAAGSWIMNLFFGMVGVVLFIVMSVVFGAGAVILLGSLGGSGSVSRSGRTSKGARRK